MALVIPPGFAHVVVPLKNAALNRSAAITFGIELPSGGPDADEIAQEVQLSVGYHLALAFDTQVSAGPTRVAIGTDGGDPVLGYSYTPVNGSRNIASLPPANAVLVLKRTARGGRRGRGAMYLPWASSEGNVDEAGTIAPADMSVLNDATSAWLDDLTEREIPMVLLHGAGLTPPPPPDTVTQLQVSPIISHQTRRQTR